jgi:hypothetical protein
MKAFDGHRSWNAWNVSLWINNDENLYRLAMDCVKYHKRRDQAATAMLDTLRGLNVQRTPDGVRYNKTTIRLAMRGM